MTSDWLFLDTSGLLCLHDKSDPRNQAAIEQRNNARGLLTTNYVLAEFVPLSQVRLHRRKETLSFIADMLRVPRLELVWVDESLHADAMRLLEGQPDKTYSLCDAVSFVVTRERGVLNALTTDKHFGQEGFIRLLAN